MWEVFKKSFRKYRLLKKGRKYNSFTMKKIVGMGKTFFLDILVFGLHGQTRHAKEIQIFILVI